MCNCSISLSCLLYGPNIKVYHTISDKRAYKIMYNALQSISGVPNDLSNINIIRLQKVLKSIFKCFKIILH